MAEFLQNDVVYLIIALTVLATLVAIGGFAISRSRKLTAEEQPLASDLLSEFRDMHSQGELSDEEYRAIKLKLGAQLRGDKPAPDTNQA